jgi:hypothetical protein
MDSYGNQHFRRFINSLPAWLLPVTLLLPTLLGIVGWIFPISLIPSNTQLYLSALAGAQASVLAIVFSVTLLGIQIATTRYASRMVPLFSRAPIFRYTFVVFVVSIAVDLIVLYNLPSRTSDLAVGGVFFTSGVAIVAAVTLAVFIPSILQLSTPDGLIEAFEHRLQPDVYLRETRTYTESNARADHPLQPLHSMVMSALSRREWATAERGLDGVKTIASTTIEELSETGDLPRQLQTRESRELFDLALKEFIPEISLHAFDEDERQLLNQSLQVQADIGRTATDNYRRFIAAEAARGLSNTIQEAPPTTEGNVIRRPGFNHLGTLLQGVTENPDPRYMRMILSRIDHQIDILFRKDADQWVYQDLLLRCFGQILLDPQETFLEYYGGYLDEVDVDWRSEYPPDGLANRSLFEAIFKWREAFVSISSRILQYRFRHEEYPMPYGNYFSTWREACSQAVESDAQEYAVVLSELYIETAYEGSIIDEDSYETWVARLASVTEENPEVVQKAFDELKTEGRTPMVRNQFYYIHQEEQPDRLGDLAKRVFQGSPPWFEQWVEEFEEDVHEDYMEYHVDE